MKKIMLFVLALLAMAQGLHAQSGISEVKLIGGDQSVVNSLKSTYKNNGWTVIESNLNAGTKGDHIYLCYKKSNNSKSCITNLYLSSSNEATRKRVETITVDGKTYTLCPFEGGGHFEGVYGDLNSFNGGADIHLYYTKSSFGDGRAVTDIWFNSKSDGAVGKDQSGKPYDLNTGAGGDDIFMHFSTVNR